MTLLGNINANQNLRFVILKVNRPNFRRFNCNNNITIQRENSRL